MTAMPAAGAMTAEEFLARPYEEANRGVELVGGVLVVDEPLLLHQLVWRELFHALDVWSRASSVGGLVTPPLDVLIGPHDVYGPDIIWYRAGREPRRDDPRPYPVPDLAIEVRSASTWRYDIGAKKSGYERAGLPELWLVDTAADVVLAFRRSQARASEFDVAFEFERGDALTSPLLPGFALAVDAVFG